MMVTVPNKPKTTLRNVRIDDQLWGDAQKVAAGNGTNVSEVIRSQLQAYVDENRNLL
jgi:antitoxin component of RelBE/YafQ-DinJ toxin-antitoxin module